MNFFLLTEEEKEWQKLDTLYRSKVSENVKSGKINLLEYSYLIDYYDNKGTLVNSQWFCNIINIIKDKDFSEGIIKIFPNFFKFDEIDNTLIKIKLTDLTNNIIEDKKENIKFTEDQNDAIEKIFKFLPDFNIKSFGLYGYAGTGKTTVIVEILTFLLKNKYIKSVAFTAPTNQAVNVIKSKFREYLNDLYMTYFKKTVPLNLSFDEILDKIQENNIKIDFITIHKLLKFEMDFGADGETMFIRSSGDSLVSEYEIIIIDECSMIPMKLVEHIFVELRSRSQKKSDNFKKIPKIIFCGDPAQLPPVNEDNSIIFLKDINNFKFDQYIKYSNINTDIDNKIIISDGDINAKHKSKHKILVTDIINMPTITLTKVMRSKLDSVTKICYQIRLWTIGETKTPNIQSYIKKGVKAYQYISGVKTDTDWFKKCLKYHKDGKSCNIILTWTNKQAFEYNQYIRNIIFKDTELKKYEVGDILMLNDFYSINTENKYKTSDVYEEKDKFYTSEQIKVINIEIITKKINTFNTTMNKNALKLQNYKYYDTQYKKIIDNINENTSRMYICWKLTVDRITIEEKCDSSTLSIIYVIHDESIKQWNDEINFISNQIRVLRKILVNKFREKTSTIDTHIIKPLWRELHKNIIEPFANVNYGYAITCHKGQGTNFYNVFVDIDDIIKNSNQSEAKKCLYTAITRTSNELHLLLK